MHRRLSTIALSLSLLSGACLGATQHAGISHAAPAAAPVQAVRARFPFPNPFGSPQIYETAEGWGWVTLMGSGFTPGGLVELDFTDDSGMYTAPSVQVVTTSSAGCSITSCWGRGQFAQTVWFDSFLSCLETSHVTAIDEDSGATVSIGILPPCAL